ncbi:site-2 protease family protein, partial [Streptococcus agalactiae]|nr:site-2 protease family protein [Streptococcus agalactiae]
DGDKLKMILPGFIFKPTLIIILSIIYCVISLKYIKEFNWIYFINGINSINYFLFFISFGLIFVVHELGHIYSSKSLDCKVGNIGIGVYMFRPVMYVNLSDSWKLSNKKRLIIDFAGIYLQMLVGLFMYFFSAVMIRNNTMDALI